jgi:hypothetical protein
MYKEYSGYMELELRSGKEYHQKALALNTARHAILYHAQALGYTRVHLPYYICDSVPDMLKKHGIDISYYAISDALLPIEKNISSNGSLLLFVNYFGLLDEAAKLFAKKYSNCLIDNCHAFFMRLPEGVSAAYSARKFFGVSDGAYLYTSARLENNLPQDRSARRIVSNMQRIEEGANPPYAEHKRAEAELANMPVQKMSQLTRRILQNVDYEHVMCVRRENFRMLHKALGSINLLHIPEDIHVPMAYPLLSDSDNLRKRLVEKRIYVPHLWPETLSKLPSQDCIEARLTNCLALLPIDQRYNNNDMDDIIRLVKASL